jgi:hypothetical protein
MTVRHYLRVMHIVVLRDLLFVLCLYDIYDFSAWLLINTGSRFYVCLYSVSHEPIFQNAVLIFLYAHFLTFCIKNPILYVQLQCKWVMLSILI